MTVAEVKHCARCDRDLPADTDHFYKRAASPDGLQSRCIECMKAAQRGRDTKGQARAYYRAMARLRALFRPDFERLYAEELERLQGDQ